MFAALRPLVEEADLALCHEEVPFARPGQPLQSFPVFAAPPQVAPWIASMGFDGCTTASNHAVDQGCEGLKHTADLLEANGVAHRHLPTARRAAPSGHLHHRAGVRVGVVAGTYGLNGFPLPEGRPWSVSLWDADNLLAQARAARAAGADIVVVHLHGGNEYDHLPNADQVALVERLTRSPDVDLVLGEHAHVVQPITKVNGTWVVYGMGNMVAQQETAGPDLRGHHGAVHLPRAARRPLRGDRRRPTCRRTWNEYGAGGRSGSNAWSRPSPTAPVTGPACSRPARRSAVPCTRSAAPPGWSNGDASGLSGLLRRRLVVALVGLGPIGLGLVAGDLDGDELGIRLGLRLARRSGPLRLRQRVDRETGGRAGERGQHLPHVGELGVDAVAALGGGRELSIGVDPNPLSGGAGVPEQVLGALFGIQDDLSGLNLGCLLLMLGRGAVLLDLLEHRVELRLGGGLLVAELGGRALPALGERGLEVGGGLGGVRALLLEGRRTVIVMVLGSNVNLAALMIRCESACAIRPRSPRTKRRSSGTSTSSVWPPAVSLSWLVATAAWTTLSIDTCSRTSEIWPCAARVTSIRSSMRWPSRPT